MDKRKITIRLSEFRIVIYYMIMFPFPLIERLFPFMDTGFKILQIMIFILCIIEIIWKNLYLKNETIIWILLFIIWGFLTTYINSPSEILFYIKGTVFPIVSMLVFTICLYGNDFDEVIYCIAKLYTVAIWINFILMIIFPNGVVYSNVGSSIYRANWLFGSKNNFVSLAPHIFFFIFFNSYELKKAKRIGISQWITLGVLFGSIISMGSNGAALMEGSTTGIVMFLTYVFVYFIKKIDIIGILNKCISIRFVSVLSILLMGMLVAISKGKFDLVDSALLVLHKDRTFSGRSYVWWEAIECIKERAILGIGSEQRIFHIYGYITNRNTGLYSFWLMIAVRYGIIGFALVLFLFFSSETISNRDNRGEQYIILSFVMIMIGGLTNPMDWKDIIFFVMTNVLYGQRIRAAGHSFSKNIFQRG